jgi:hypothetical protein
MLGGVRHSSHLYRNSSGERATSAVDHAIAALASRQYGVVTREQLRALGLSEDEIDYRIAVGRLRVIHRAVYAVGHDRLSPEGRWLAASHRCDWNRAMHRAVERLD